MRVSLKVGLLAAVIACVAFAAAKAQEEKSYLPPTWFKEKSESAAPEKEAAPKVKARGVPRAVRPAPRVAHHVRPHVRHAKLVTKQRHVAFYRHNHRRVRLVNYRYHPRYYHYYPRYAYYRPAFPSFPFGLLSW